jgi:hypothetical protein
MTHSNAILTLAYDAVVQTIRPFTGDTNSTGTPDTTTTTVELTKTN